MRKSFIQFVKEQPRERPITHDTWASCALGDYRSKVLKKSRSPGTWASKEANSTAAKAIGNEKLYLYLGENSRDLLDEEVPNYGALADWIDANIQQ